MTGGRWVSLISSPYRAKLTKRATTTYRLDMGLGPDGTAWSAASNSLRDGGVLWRCELRRGLRCNFIVADDDDEDDDEDDNDGEGDVAM